MNQKFEMLKAEAEDHVKWGNQSDTGYRRTAAYAMSAAFLETLAALDAARAREARLRAFVAQFESWADAKYLPVAFQNMGGRAKALLAETEARDG